MIDKRKAIEKILCDHNYRLTQPRMKMIELFLTTSQHLCAKKIYHHVQHENVSLPTVYRNLLIFKQLGIIKETNISNENVYELKAFSKKRLHMHFHCKVCGQIIEYKSREIFNQMLQQQYYIEEKYGDIIQGYSVVFEGVCHKCKLLEEENAKKLY